MTQFIASGKHPGGEIIVKGCGKDATELFHTQAGKDTDRPDTAQQFLQTMEIGTVAQ